jgi:hypothetical protein
MRNHVWLIATAAWVGMIGLSGCAGTERVVMRFQNMSCQWNGGVPVDDKCLEAYVPVEPPRYCYQNLARIDCYAEPVRFGTPDPGLLRAAPPDLGN